MIIGLDLDNTICSTDKKIKKYSNIYCQEKQINEEVLWTNDEYKQDFLRLYLEKIYKEAQLKQNCKKVLQELKKKNYKLLIITARRNKYLSVDMKTFIYNYFKKRNIIIDGIILDAKDKVDACKEKKVDIMLEDSIYNYNLLKESNVNVVLFDEKNNSEIKQKITNWNQFLEYISKYVKRV